MRTTSIPIESNVTSIYEMNHSKEHDFSVSSLQSFTKLQTIKVSLALLVRHQNDRCTAVRLADNMPSSLEELIVGDHNSFDKHLETLELQRFLESGE